MARYQVLYWQDVPSLVKVFDDAGASTSQQLPDWFQQEIDRRAMAQGLVGSDEYLEQWHWGDPATRDESGQQLLDAVIAELVDDVEAGHEQ